MKTSRMARETAKVVTAIANAGFVPRRQTRSSAANLQAFTSNDLPLQADQHRALKREGTDCGSSSPSSDAPDIEDALSSVSASRKRKRGFDTPSTAVTTITTSSTTRTSPRKAGIRTEAGANGKVKKAKRQPAKKIVHEDGEVRIEAPANWEEIYDTVRDMRKEKLAPVDTMGCESLAEERLSAEVYHPSISRFMFEDPSRTLTNLSRTNASKLS